MELDLSYLLKTYRKKAFIKFVDEDGTPPIGRLNPSRAQKYQLPKKDAPGEWHPDRKPIMCVKGYHVCKRGQEISHRSYRAFLAEVRGDTDTDDFSSSKSVHESMRLLFELKVDRDVMLKVFKKHLNAFEGKDKKIIEKHLGLRRSSGPNPMMGENGRDTYHLLDVTGEQKNWRQLAAVCSRAVLGRIIFSEILWKTVRKQAPNWARDKKHRRKT